MATARSARSGPSTALSWRTVNKAVTALAEGGVLGEPEPTRVLGIDETRARSVRWVLEEAGWKRTNPWMTSFVNADTTGPGRLLGLAPGRSGACVKDWLALQTEQFRAGIELVVIDPSAPYAAGIRAALPQAAIAVDKWHLVTIESPDIPGWLSPAYWSTSPSPEDECRPQHEQPNPAQVRRTT